MDNIVGFLKKRASGKLVLGLSIPTLAVYLTMVLSTLPAVGRFAPGKVLFDLSFAGYSYEYAVSLLEALGPDGRSMYLYRQLPLDFIFPGLFAISSPLLLTWVFSKSYAPGSRIFYFCVIPFLGGIFDYLENICIIQMLRSYPAVPHGLVNVSSTFTILKSVFTTVYFVLLLAGIIKVYKIRRARVHSQS
jgi:hypothetical protein